MAHLAALLLVLAVLLPCSLQVWSTSEASGLSTDCAYLENSAVLDEVIIGFLPGVSQQCRTSLVEQHGGLVLKTNSVLDFVVAKTPDPHAFMAGIAAETGVRYVEPNMTVQSADTWPDDPYWGQQWGPQAIRADLAWAIETGSSSITIAVIDTGVDYTHADLGNYMSGGYDYVNDHDNPMDDHGHGTFVAGIAAATINNDTGIAGIAQVNILAFKVLGSDGKGDTADVAAAIQEAADMGADVINMSLGGESDSYSLRLACNYAWEQGSLLIAAAGNDGSEPDYDGGIMYPAAYDTVIAVGSIDQSGSRSHFSNWGPEMELAAPGSGIVSTAMGNNYGTGNGTSYAAPHVAGVAALIWSRAPDLTNQLVRDILRETAHDLGIPGWDQEYGYGRVDAYDAMLATAPAIDSVSPDSAYRGQEISVAISGTNFTGVSLIDFGPGINVVDFEIAGPTQIDAVLTIDKDAAPGPRDVSVMTHTGTGTLPGGFTVDANQPPDKPANLSPGDGATGISLTPDLSSSAFSDPDAGDWHAASRWQVSTVPGDYAKTVFDSGRDTTNLTSITLSGLETGTTYYWRARYQDNHGAWSAWSEETWFRTSYGPDRPANESPADGATAITLSPVLESSGFNDPDAYGHAASQWQVRQASGSYHDPVLDSDRDTLNLTSLALAHHTLRSNSAYYWRVRYQNEQELWSDWSEETSFTTDNRAPHQPENTSPSDGATGLPVDVTLESGLFFDPDPGDTHAASQWQITTVAGNYASPVFDSERDADNLTSIALPDDTLDGNTTYYWQVRYQDNHGKWSEWSKETSFTTMNRPPDRPVNSGPADAAGDVDLTPLLEASAFSDPDSADTHAASQWQVWTDSGAGFTIVLDSGRDTEDLELFLVPAGILDGNTTYYWRVRYQDNHDEWSNWSMETPFTTLNRPPDQPLNQSPAKGATQVSLTPKLVSSAFSDPDSGHEHWHSEWQVTTVPESYDYPDLVFWSGITPAHRESITLPAGELDHTTVYYWRVRYQDKQGERSEWSEWSKETSFMTISRPPDRPAGTHPAHGATGTSLTPTLESSAFTDPDPGDQHAASRWRLWPVDGSHTTPLLDIEVESGDLTALNVPAGLLDYSTSYYWQVKYQDSYGTWSDFSKKQSFTTLHSVPHAPQNAVPPAGATGIAISPVVEASEFSDPDSRNSHAASQWQLTAVAGDYSSPLFDSGRSTGQLTSISLKNAGLDYGKTYYWHVRYQNQHGNWSAYSAETAFTVYMPPPPIADFESDRTSGDGPLTVQFTDQSSGYVTSWQWDLNGNGVVDSTDRSPAFTYEVPGEYTVILTVTGPGGTNTETKKDFIEVPEPAAGGVFGCFSSEVSAPPPSAFGLATGWVLTGLAMLIGPVLVRQVTARRRR